MTIEPEVHELTAKQPIKKRTVTINRYFDEEGRLSSEDIIEEIEYVAPEPLPEFQSVPQVAPGWWQNPVISNSNINQLPCATAEHPCEAAKEYVDNEISRLLKIT